MAKDINLSFYKAVQNNQADSARALLDQGANIEFVPDNSGQTALHLACANNNLAMVKLLIEKKAKPNEQIKANGSTPLFIAAQLGYHEVVTFLISSGADKNKQNSQGMTPLSIASFHGHLKVVKTLVDNKANVNLAMPDGTGPLYIASMKGYFEIVKYLGDNGADIEQQSASATPLYIACQNGFLNIVQYLHKKGANLNTKTSLKVSPLHAALNLNRKDVALFLVNNGANLNQVLKNDMNELHIAYNCGLNEIADILMQKGARADTVDEKERKPFDYYKSPIDLSLAILKDFDLSQSSDNEVARIQGFVIRNPEGKEVKYHGAWQKLN